MSTNKMPPEEQAPEAEAPEETPEDQPASVSGAPEEPNDGPEDPRLNDKMAAAMKEMEKPPPPEDPETAPPDGEGSSVAKAARDERMRLMPEYLEHFFLEDLPPIDANDPWNQGIYMRYRINQMRSAQGKEPVV